MEKWPQPFGLRLKKHHSALLVAYLELPNRAPRALIGVFSGATGTIQLVLTGPNLVTVVYDLKNVVKERLVDGVGYRLLVPQYRDQGAGKHRPGRP